MVVTSGLSEETTVRSVLCASGKRSSSGWASGCPSTSSSGALSVGENPAWGTDVVVGWLETGSAAVVD